MLVKVLKAFPYAREGKFTAMLDAGSIEDLEASVIEGLFAEGFIDEATQAELEAAQVGPSAIRSPVEIPAAWRELHWFKLRALAAAIAGGAVSNKTAAVAVIEAELQARGA